MRHILSIAIILCLLILLAVYFLSDSEPEITQPGFTLEPEQETVTTPQSPSTRQDNPGETSSPTEE
ncbi:MAG: hypothetical protein ACFE0K_09110 [Alcanivorax sp.]|uniref:hypothetical protein n=1 Tax=Alcanivorax sp. TaxID=1872427 RepID=UPI003DA71AE8